MEFLILLRNMEGLCEMGFNEDFDWDYFEDSPVYSHKIIGYELPEEIEIAGSAQKRYAKYELRYIWDHLLRIGWAPDENPIYGYPLIGSGLDCSGNEVEIRLRVDYNGNAIMFHALSPVTNKMEREMERMEVVWEAC